MRDKTRKPKSTIDVKGKDRIPTSKKPFIKDKPYLDGKNDIKWRTSDEVMTKLVASLPFGLAAGLTAPVNMSGPSGITFRQSGVLTVLTRVTLGNVTDYNSPFNLACRKVYSYVRHANSGSKNYEAADMGVYFGALGQVLALLGFMQRVLRVITEFSSTNRYTPASLLRAMGVDYVSMIDNQPQLKWLIAWMGRAIGSLAFPDMPYFHACYEAYKYVYRDNDSPKEQFYVNSPECFAIYNPVHSATGGGLEYSGGVTPWKTINTVGALLSFSELSAYVHERMDVLLGDEDCGIISGDILKAYKDGGLFKPEPFGDDYEVLQHSQEALQQFHNARIMESAKCDLDAYEQNVGGVNQAPYITHKFNVGTSFPNSVCLLDMYIDAFSKEPDASEVVNCSVLQTLYTTKADAGGTVYIDPTSVIFDLFLPTAIVFLDDISASGVAVNMAAEFYNAGTAFYAVIANRNLQITNFDWHPLIIKLSANNTGAPIYVVGDIQNFRFFTREVAGRIHENSMLSLFKYADNNFY